MGVGHQNKRIGAIIQARYDSSRLPGKVLFNLPFHSEETVLSQIIKRLRSCNFLDHIIVATSDQKDDDPIEKEALLRKAEVYRGSKQNVLKRYCHAARKFDLNVIIRITGDNPIVLTETIEEAVNQHLIKEYDYTTLSSLSLGMNFEIVNLSALERSLNSNPTDQEKEHVTLYLKNNIEKHNFSEVKLIHNKNSNNIRLTIDYPSDYALLNLLFTYLEGFNNQYNIENIHGFFNCYPWAIEINKGNKQKT